MHLHCDRLLVLQPSLPLHQATLELDNAAAVAAIGDQQQKRALKREQQHTRLPWQLLKLALHQCQLRHPLHLRHLQLPA